MKRSRNLNGVRGFWILSIVVCHFISEWSAFYSVRVPSFILNGSTAANGFFILSGMLICLRHGDGQEASGGGVKGLLSQIRNEYVRNYKKLFLFNLIGQVPFFFWYVHTTGDMSKYAAGKMLMNLLMVQNWIPYKNYTMNPVGWFLSVLMACYVLSPIMFRVIGFLKRKTNNSPVTAVLLILLSLLWLYLCARFPKLPQYKDVAYHPAMFLLGIGAGELIKSFKTKENRVWTAAGVVILFMCYFIVLGRYYFLIGSAALTAALAFLYIGSDSIFLSGRWFTLFGETSLAIMMIHPMMLIPLQFLYKLPAFSGKTAGLLLCILFMIITIASAVLLYKGTERLKKKTRF